MATILIRPIQKFLLILIFPILACFSLYFYKNNYENTCNVFIINFNKLCNSSDKIYYLNRNIIMELTIKNSKDWIKIKQIVRHNILIKDFILIKNKCYIKAIPEEKIPKISIHNVNKQYNKNFSLKKSQYKVTKNYLVKNKF